MNVTDVFTCSVDELKKRLTLVNNDDRLYIFQNKDGYMTIADEDSDCKELYELIDFVVRNETDEVFYFKSKLAAKSYLTKWYNQIQIHPKFRAHLVRNIHTDYRLIDDSE